jgi:hypothetical protein
MVERNQPNIQTVSRKDVSVTTVRSWGQETVWWHSYKCTDELNDNSDEDNNFSGFITTIYVDGDVKKEAVNWWEGE